MSRPAYQYAEKMRTAAVIAIALLSAGGVFILWAGRTMGNRPPQARFPAVVDLGVQEMGAIVKCRIPFENVGRKTLVVSDISTSCSCAGFEIETETGSQAVRSFSVKTGEIVTISARVAVRAQGAGERVSLEVTFRTNDPEKPKGRLQIVVTEVRGGVLPVPDRVAFGEVTIGKQAEQKVDLWDPKKVGRKSALHPLPEGSPISVDFVDSDRVGTAHGAVQEGMTFVGQLHIKVDTRKEVACSGLVAVSPVGEDRKPDQVPVFVNVVRPVVCSPSVLVLPVTSGQNRRYEGAIMLRAMDGRSITRVSLIDRPEWCECVVPESWASSHGVIKVKVDAELARGQNGSQASVGRLSFSARVGEDEVITEAEVRVMP